LEVSFEWLGSNQAKGLGVFGFNGWTVQPLPEVEPDPWCLPLLVVSPTGTPSFTLLAVWTITPRREVPAYAAQFSRTIDRWADVLKSEPVVIAGDLNASIQGPSTEAHRRNLERLRDLGVVSAYHEHHSVAHGAEEAMTLRWIGPGRGVHYYHCDFAFLSRVVAPHLAGAHVGTVPDWIETGLSDHCPVIVDLALPERTPGFSGTSTIGRDGI
jgi:hypothetical protein